jgi:hypothetical protein
MIAAAFLDVAIVQVPDAKNTSTPTSPASPVRAVTSTLAIAAPDVDGRDIDDVWRSAIVISEFREFQPVEDKDPRYRTEAMVAHDERNFYVFVRAFDPSPDSIETLLARRDTRAPTDQIKIVIDSYHDRRTGYEFAVNPAGVKRDYAIYNDEWEDVNWDAVWDVATQVDSLGWTAEFRIPLSQLRFVPSESNTFGFGVWRDIERHTERVSWPLYRVSQPGLASQLGEVGGLVGLEAPRRLELSPYTVAKSVPQVTATGTDQKQEFTAGADVKYGITSNLTLTATVNPDFGQVEADPAVLNLSAFETFFSERRPFFVEGRGLFEFDVNCSAVNCGGEGLFYSRRIGRAPQLAGVYGDETSPTQTTIIGAGKLTGRVGGFTVAALEALTLREAGVDDRTIEPTTNYAVTRLQQDFRNGESNAGVMFTAVNRALDQSSEPYLRRDAYVGALDLRHRFADGTYEIRGAIGGSYLGGSAEAIGATQTSSTHYYQRPDGDLTFDPTRTSLTGNFQQVYFGKVGGERLLFETSYQRRSAGFDPNDIGFLRRADEQAWNTWAGLRFRRPTSVYQMAYWNFNWWQIWTAGGLPTERAANTNAHVQLNNRWWLHAGFTPGLGGTYCDRCARGGPAVRESPWLSAWAGFEGDQRKIVVPELFFNFNRSDEGRSTALYVEPFVSLRIASRFNTSFGMSYSRNKNDTQWFGNFADSTGALHYTFAHLDQTTLSLTLRLNYTFTPNLTLQLYAQPFVSKGTYSNVRELDQPRAAAYEDRYRPYDDLDVAGNPGGFNVTQFRSNVVLRWEYQPGSTLFLVWQQGRQGFLPEEGANNVWRDLGDLFDQRADNTLLIKASYWINR